MKLIVVLNNIRSCLNVGAILRTAEGFGVERVIFSGYTPRMNDERVLPHLREKINKQIAKTALGAERYLKLQTTEDVFGTLDELKEEKYKIVGLENNLEDERKIKMSYKKIAEVCSTLNSRNNRGGVVLILGEEVNGIDRKLYDKIDMFLEIPMRGKKESFNVSVAAGIGMFYLSEIAAV